MKNKTKINYCDTIENHIKRHILDQESCDLQIEMYKAYHSLFVEKNKNAKNVFVCLTHKQTTDINNTIQKYLKRYLKRIQKVSA